jgi:hypothetical protein
LPFQGIHLPRHFLENIVHPGEVLFGIFQACFGKALLGLELGDP